MSQEKQPQAYSNGHNQQMEPDPEVRVAGKRRRYSQAYKLQVLAEAEQCKQGETGAVSAIVDGALQSPQRDMYLFRAMAGQMTIIEIHSTDGRANFMLSGVNDGQSYKQLEDEQRLWSAPLPSAQDYLLTIAVPADAPFTEYRVQSGTDNRTAKYAVHALRPTP